MVNADILKYSATDPVGQINPVILWKDAVRTLFNKTKMLLLKHYFTCISHAACVLLGKACENMFAWLMLHKIKLYCTFVCR